MVENIENDINLRQIFSREGIDHISRFNPNKPIEALVRYWRKRVDTHYERMSGIITLEVRAFTPEDSLRLAEKILAQCEKLVNDLSQRSRRDALKQAKLELQRAEVQLKGATAEMREAQNSQGVLDATVEAESINKIVTQAAHRIDTCPAADRVARRYRVDRCPPGSGAQFTRAGAAGSNR